MKKLTRKQVISVIDEWESLTDINQYRDVWETQKELNEQYDKVRDAVNTKT